MKCYSIGSDPLNRDDIDIKFIEYGYDEPVHFHDAIEIVYVVSGQGEHIIDEKSFKAQRGFLTIMDYSCIHSVHMWENMKYYNILFKASFLSNSLDQDENMRQMLKQYFYYDLSDKFLCTEFHDVETAQKIEELFFEILEEGISKKVRYIDLIRCHLDEIISLTLRNVSQTVNSRIDEMLAEAIEYISNNCADALMLEDVAKKFNYNSKYFSNKLKEYCGLSFKQLLLRKRLSNVIYNLWKTEEPIEEIIPKCGFTNKTYFYEVFAKNYGVKPKFVREYRDNYNKYLELKANNKNLLN